MAVIPPTHDESPELYDDSLLLDVGKSSENAGFGDDGGDRRLNSSADRGYSSASFSHWSQSWSKPTEACRDSLLPYYAPSVDRPQDSAGIGVEILPSSSLSNNSSRPLMGAGLENLGNTCFLNSVLQCFIHTVPLLQEILLNGHLAHSNNNSANKESFCLLCVLRDLILGSLSSNTTLSPWDLVNNLTYISTDFQRFQQEDAHEFLQCFLDKLEGCHNSETPKCSSLQSDNIVQQVFGGRLVSNLKCCNCGHCSDTYEPTIDLSLEIDDADSLFTALLSFTKVEKIEDPENKFICEKCNEPVYVAKKLSFDLAPSVAVLHLKRFKNDGSFVEKIDKHVAFPLDLNLEPFTVSGKCNYAELQYVLYAVVVHIGLRPTSGHYYCFIRLSSDTWCKFDDSMVELVPEDYVLSQEAYVLFYAKENTPWFSSFIESQKEFVNSTIWNTSPKSVLESVGTSFSPSLDNKFGCSSNELNYDIKSAHEGANDKEIKCRAPVQNIIESQTGAYDPLEKSDSVAPFSGDSSNISTPKAQKVSPVLLEKVCRSEEAAFRSPSPEIYRENSPDVGFTICRSHLKIGDSVPCKRRLDKDLDDERKQAQSLIQKNMPSSRRQQLLAALRGSKTEPSVNRKKTRRLTVQ